MPHPSYLLDLMILIINGEELETMELLIM
jgi:hypothetical protein